MHDTLLSVPSMAPSFGQDTQKTTWLHQSGHLLPIRTPSAPKLAHRELAHPTAGPSSVIICCLSLEKHLLSLPQFPLLVLWLASRLFVSTWDGWRALGEVFWRQSGFQWGSVQTRREHTLF